MFIDYKECRIASKAVKKDTYEKKDALKEKKLKKENTTRESQAQVSRYSKYTSLNVSRTQILMPCS